jgi:hypothetical protein
VTSERQEGAVNRAEPDTELHCSPVLRSDAQPTGETDGAGAERREAPPASALPCLFSNKCTEEEKTEKETTDPVNILKGGHKRSAQVLYLEIMALVKAYGLNRIGFLTMTFKDHVTNLREAQRRFRSIRTHVIVKRYERAIAVWERQKSGRIHFHLVVVVNEDIRTGANFEAFKRQDYRSANAALRGEWAFWLRTCPKYRFGRHELMPVKSNAEGVARYVGKYISKHIRQRVADDKGARLVRYIGYKAGERTASCRFSWNSENAWIWRHKVAAYAKRHGVTDLDGMRRKFGPRWAYQRCREILAEPLRDIVFPSESAAMRSFNEEWEVVVARDKAERLIEKLPVNRTVLVGNETINDYWPVLDVAASPDQEVASTPWSPEVRRQFDEKAREMRLYAARLEVLEGRNLGIWK